LARRLRDSSEAEEVSYLKELYGQNDPEAVIRAFESQPSLHTNSAALSEYVRALVKVDKLDESELLETLQRGDYLARTACFLLTVFAFDHAFPSNLITILIPLLTFCLVIGTIIIS